MTDIDVIKHIESEIEKDSGFTGRTDKEYLAYLQGQKTGAKRVMAYLRQKRILRPIVKDNVRYYLFA